MQHPITAGDRVSTTRAFISPIGCYFAAGSVFVVEIVGTKNIRCRAEQCGSVVWIADGVFATR